MISSMTDLPLLAAYLQRIGAEPRSLRTAVVKEHHGSYWTDVATIRIKKEDGSIDAPSGYEPTAAEAAAIKVEVLGAKWPVSVMQHSWDLPLELKNTESIFELKDIDGKLLMIQQRISDPKNGEKRYVPWSYWSDGQWRRAEPEGPLPLYGLDKLGDNTTVFIHEGAKAAAAMQRLINPQSPEEIEAFKAHPWGQELSGAAHLGWIGGALNPSRTDWSTLTRNGVLKAYIVADNDRPGKAAIPKIARKLKGITTFALEFTDIWPVGFDLADPFPEKMFCTTGSYRHYIGPSFREVLHPATWATDLVPTKGKGRPPAVLRQEFSDLWVWAEEADTFVCRELPEINYSIGQFNSLVGPFSDVQGTGQLLHKTYKGRIAKICYRPDLPQRIVTDRTTSAINLHTPTNIRPLPGDVGPWIEFMEYLFPIERERQKMMRWCATLVARPEIRMLYGLLLVSERQGMGKSTLGERILAPLVGMHNASFPGERDIVESNFNGWIAHKRLVVVGEIYTGQSFKAYNILKSYITDKNINVNEKFKRPYTTENWAHVVACSNSKKALRVEETDRRWFYPLLNDVPWNMEKWGEFYSWLHAGGLGVIMRWAHEFGDYVMPGEHPPMTASKRELIEDSRGEVINHWLDVLAAIEEEGEEVIFSLTEVREAMQKKHGRVYETAYQFRKEAERRGWATPEKRLKIDGAMTYIIVSPAAAETVRRNWDPRDEENARRYFREKLTRLLDRLSAVG